MADVSVPIRFPLSSFPGASTQESAGRIVNAYSEPLEDQQLPSGPNQAVWRRSPGLSQLNNSATGQTGYRGGLIVNNLSYEVWKDKVLTIDANGTINGPLTNNVTGTKKISIARNQANPPDIIICDPDTGAYAIAGVPTVPPVQTYQPVGPPAMPQANSVCFQDGYFFLGIADCRVFATNINSLTMATGTSFIQLQSKSDVVGQRVIAYSGVLLGFTSGGMEIWQDTAQPAPAFPYSRQAVLPYGLIQPAAIAGFETGFDDLIWAAQDFGVYRLPWGTYSPGKISPPDLERFIETQVRIGNLLEAGCYEFAGKKFWTLTSNNAGVTWEFNLSTLKWNERTSLQMSIGAQSRWRGLGGHPAFGKWLMGDSQSGNILYPDDTNYTDNGAPQLVRLESGPVEHFPQQIRIARADFEFVTGVGSAVNNLTRTVLGATASPNIPLIRLQLNNTSGFLSGDQINVSGILGTLEANGTWVCTVIDGFHIDLQLTTFVNPYVAPVPPVPNGIAMDVTEPNNVTNPVVAVSVSKDGGINWGNPLVRSLGQQQKSARVRVSVKSMGQSGVMGVRWRLEVSDGVYTALLKATMSSDPRIPRL